MLIVYNLSIMSNSTVLQVRANARLVKKAQAKAAMLGYSSLQEIVRVFLSSFVRGKAEPAVISTQETERFPPEHIKLGPKATKRWEKIMRDADEDKNMYSFADPEEALEFLFSEDR